MLFLRFGRAYSECESEESERSRIVFGVNFECLFDGTVMVIDTAGFQSTHFVQMNMGYIDIP